MEKPMKKRTAGLALTVFVAAITVAGCGFTATAIAHPAQISLESVFPGVSLEQATGEFVRFTSKEGAFSVKLPGEPKQTDQESNSGLGPTVLHMFVVERNAGKYAYLVGYSDYAAQMDSAKTLENVIAAQAKSINGKITADKKVTLNGWPGRMVTIEGDAVVFLSGAFVAETRLYQIIFVMQKGDTPPPDTSEFFDSFEITFKGSSGK
jgi:hypothetical protein